MKKVPVLIVVMVVLCTVLSCSNVETGMGGIPEWASDLMKKVPYDSVRARFTNVQAIRKDPDLQYLYSDWRHSFNYTSVNLYMPSLVNYTYYSQTICDLNQADFLVEGQNSSFIIAIVDVEKVESYLNGSGWSRSEYENFSVWSKEIVSGEYRAEKSIAFDQRYVIAGLEAWVNSTIDTIKGKQASIYQKTQFQDLMSLLPEMAVDIIYSEDDFEIEQGSSIKLITGGGIYKKNTDYIRYTYIVTGQNGSLPDTTVEALMEELNKDEQFSQSGIKTKRSGIYVIFTADVPLSIYSEDD